MVRAPQGSVYSGELGLGSPAWLGQKISLEGSQGCEHRGKMWNWTCRCDWEHRKHWENAAQTEQDQPLAQSHIVAMKSQKIEIFNLANCLVYFVEVPLNITTFSSWFWNFQNNHTGFFFLYSPQHSTVNCAVLGVEINIDIKPEDMEKLLFFPQ